MLVFSVLVLDPSQRFDKTLNDKENSQHQQMPLDSSLYYECALLNGDSLTAYDLILEKSLHF